MTNEIDYWYVISCILFFIVGFLLTENYKLRKIKKRYIEIGKEAIRLQKMSSIFDAKTNIKDIK